METEKEMLKAIPVNPYELTEVGIRDLRKTILVGILSLAVCMVMSLILFKWVFGSAGMGSEGLTVMLLKLGGYLSILFLSVWGLNKSSEYLFGTGLYWRLMASDALQDEWELAQKRRSYAKAYEYVLRGICIIFLLTLLYCGVYFALNRTLPAPPSFGVSLIVSVMLINIAALTPIIHVAWTLAPIEDEGASYKRSISPIPSPFLERTESLTSRQKWLKHIWNWSPVIIGGIIGYTWMMHG